MLLFLAGTGRLAAATGETATVIVEAPPLRLPAAAPETFSVAGVAAGVPGVTLSSQGYLAPQSDLRIRGSSFDSCGFLLSGLALRNPQSEHFQSELPLPEEILLEPVLLTGLDRFRLSPGYPSGSLSLDFASAAPGGFVEYGAGNRDHRFGRLLAGEARRFPSGSRAGGTVFAAFDRVGRTDGQADNDLDRWQAGGHGEYRDGALRADLLAAYATRDFGARGFYGAPPDWPASEEVDDGLLLATVRGEPAIGVSARLTAAWRRVEDLYLLDRDRPALYADRTRSDVLGLHAQMHGSPGGPWSADARADADWERVDGAHEGAMAAEAPGRRDRRRAAFALLPARAAGPLTFQAGAAAEIFSDDRAAWLPAAGVTWRFRPEQSASASYSEAVQPPSLAERSGNPAGAPDAAAAERLHTRTVETGWRFETAPLIAQVALFAERARHAADWARLSGDAPWTAVSLGEVRTFGCEAAGACVLAERCDLTLSYRALDREADGAAGASRYALDYPRHEVRAGLRLRSGRRLRFHVWQAWAAYAGNTARSGPDEQHAAGAEVAWHAWPGKATLTLGALNPWDDPFQVFPGQPAEGRRLYAAGRLEW
jgi:hypothetical protein